jgi:D-alanyl-D-alanine carboxypeptidase/D-alanyl-D-alanine-endopeptidase (penicillin-binding protein 4)
VKSTLTLIVLAALLTLSGCNKANHPAGLSPGPSSLPAKTVAKATEEIPLHAVSEYKETLVTRALDLDNQGILIESLNGEQRFAEHNADYTFNPASVMKLATSLVALRKFPPDHRFRTNFLADGNLDTAQRKLEGDLVVEGGSDPKFSLADAQEVATELSRLGVSRVTGSLRVAGPFYYYARGYTSNLSRETSASKLRKALQAAGIKIDGETVFGEKSGAPLLSHYSDQLDHILLYQNAFSSNAVAEVLGEAVGGPQVIQEFLIEELDLEHSEVYVGRASGLDFNRITPRASLKVLRALLAELEKYSLQPEDILPVAGIDSGTLRARLSREDVRGAVLAKTGTLVSMDKGVSTLVGIAYTKAHGPLLFAIFNSDGNVNAYRRLQDQFVEKIIAEQGGAVPVSRQQDALAEEPGNSINQVLFKNKPQPITEGSTD